MKVLDLYCGVGGVSAGFLEAGWEVVGVDIERQIDYVAPKNFMQGDAIKMLKELATGFDLIWASPPCQAFSFAAARWKDRKRADLVARTRNAILKTGKPYIIENVVQAPLLKDKSITLTGPQVGLIPRYSPEGILERNGKRYIPGVIKMRRFESNLPLQSMPRVGRPGLEGGEVSVRAGDYVTLAGHGGNNPVGLNRLDVWEQSSGINWLYAGRSAAEKKHSIAEAIPPAMARALAEQAAKLI